MHADIPSIGFLSTPQDAMTGYTVFLRDVERNTLSSNINISLTLFFGRLALISAGCLAGCSHLGADSGLRKALPTPRVMVVLVCLQF